MRVEDFLLEIKSWLSTISEDLRALRAETEAMREETRAMHLDMVAMRDEIRYMMQNMNNLIARVEMLNGIERSEEGQLETLKLVGFGGQVVGFGRRSLCGRVNACLGGTGIVRGVQGGVALAVLSVRFRHQAKVSIEQQNSHCSPPESR